MHEAPDNAVFCCTMRALHESKHTNTITDDAAHMAWYCMRQLHVHAVNFLADIVSSRKSGIATCSSCKLAT